MDETGKRRISIERMAAIWRWATGDGEVKDLAFGDVDELKFNCDTFAEFIELNKDGVQLYEAGEAP